MQSEMIREIVDVYLIKKDNQIVALGPVSVLEECQNKAKEKNITITSRKITTNTVRANEIGFNLFKVNYPVSGKENLVKFRNSVIKEWIDRCAKIKNSDKKIIWGKVASKHNIPFSSPEEFSQSIMDKIEFA